LPLPPLDRAGSCVGDSFELHAATARVSQTPRIATFRFFIITLDTCAAVDDGVDGDWIGFQSAVPALT